MEINVEYEEVDLIGIEDRAHGNSVCGGEVWLLITRVEANGIEGGE